jgi:hypothetical protein
MNPPGSLLLCPAIAFAIVALWRRRRMLRDSWPGTAAEFLVPLLLGVLLYAYFETLLLNVRWGWSASRLAPTIGLFHGYPLYSPLDVGPINGWLHGPVAPLLWTPAALADSPLPALTIAGAINLLFLLLPLLAASMRFSTEVGPPRLLGFVFGAAGLLLIYPTWYMASVLCSDAIAAGLGLASCLVLLGPTSPGTQRLVLASLLAVLAAWTKQTEAPLVIAQIAWLGFVHGRRVSLKYCAVCAAGMIGATAIVLGLMGSRDVILNMWTIPSSQRLTGTWAAAWNELGDFTRYSLLFSLPCLLVLPPAARASGPGGSGPNPRPAAALLVAVALVMLPLGLMASIKIGGDRNSMHSVYYLAGAAVIGLTHAWSSMGLRSGWPRWAALLAAAVVAALAAKQVSNYPNMTMLPPRCLSQEAWVFAKLHPYQTFFAQDSLSTIMAEGRMYHFDYAVLDREYAGIISSEKHIRQGLPDHLSAVVYPRADGAQTIVKEFLPEFVFFRATDDFIVYRRPGEK